MAGMAGVPRRLPCRAEATGPGCPACRMRRPTIPSPTSTVYEQLREWRSKPHGGQAALRWRPPVLEEILRRRPRSTEELIEVRGDRPRLLRKARRVAAGKLSEIYILQAPGAQSSCK